MRIRLAAVLAAVLMSASSAPGRAADEALIAAAKKEGEVVWYTTQILDPLVLRLQDAFRRKYGIEIKPVRQNSTELAIRVSNEAKAGRVQADVYDGTTTAEVLKKEGLALKWLPEIAKELPKDYVDPDGYWIGTNYYLITAAFNTDLVKPGTEPKHWDDLLDPRFKGQIVWGNTVSISAGPASSASCSRTSASRRAWITCASSRNRRSPASALRRASSSIRQSRANTPSPCRFFRSTPPAAAPRARQSSGSR
jgi:spermidine/putrescine-binding protein